MSDHIAHLGFCDDTFRLAALHPDVEPRFKPIMDAHREEAHLGAITRYADKWTVPMVHWARVEAAKPSEEQDPHLDDKIAFMLGSLTHRSADRLTKPITKCFPGKDASGNPIRDERGGNANESKIMQDLFVYREVYAQGDEGGGLFSPLDIGEFKTPAARQAEDLYRILLRRAFIAMHTINPDVADTHDWMNKLFKGMQSYPKSLEEYRELNEAWDPGKVKLYLTEKHFYDADDELIALARKLQHGGSVTGEAVKAAHTAVDADTAIDQSRYARSLAKSLDYLLAATAAFRGEIDEAETARRFDIGVPELSLQK